MSRRAFRTGDWLNKARAAGITIQLNRTLCHVEISLPYSSKTNPATARVMAALFGCDQEEAERRYTNLGQLVFDRAMKRRHPESA